MTRMTDALAAIGGGQVVDVIPGDQIDSGHTDSSANGTIGDDQPQETPRTRKQISGG